MGGEDKRMIRVLRKVIEKRVNCPKCGCELSFDDSDEKSLFVDLTSMVDKTRFITCPCNCCVITRDIVGNISQNVTLITADATEEANNG